MDGIKPDGSFRDWTRAHTGPAIIFHSHGKTGETLPVRRRRRRRRSGGIRGVELHRDVPSAGNYLSNRLRSILKKHSVPVRTGFSVKVSRRSAARLDAKKEFTLCSCSSGGKSDVSNLSPRWLGNRAPLFPRTAMAPLYRRSLMNFLEPRPTVLSIPG